MISRDLEMEIQNLFTESGEDILRLNYIAKNLGISSEDDDFELLKDILLGMVEVGLLEKLSRQRYSIANYDNTSEFEGKLIIRNHKAYVETDHSEIKSIYIRQGNLNTALPGDIVTAVLHAVKKNKKKRKYRGEVIEIVERNQDRIVGIVENDGMFYFLVPDEPDYYVDFLIPETYLNSAKIGDKVSASLIKWNDPQKNPKVEVREVLGSSGSVSVEFDSVLYDFDLHEDFPIEVEEEALAKKAPINRAIKGRFDLRDEYIITIDPDDAKDYDDALSLKILENGNYMLGVHIADVSHYVEEGTALDNEAKKRGNSTYLVDRVIPMLPRNLSNNICSLVPNEVRYTMTCFMEITPRGEVVNYKIGPGIIKSKRRYTYDEVLNIINTKESPNPEDDVEFILNLNTVAQILRARRFKKGGIAFETTEYKFTLDEDCMPNKAIIKRANTATTLVEDCMLVCNQTVAKFISELSKELGISPTLPFMYRVHDLPDGVRLHDTLKYLQSFEKGIDIKAFSSQALNEVLKKFEGKPEEETAHQLLIRTMAKAEYTSKNIGHFGLGFDYYSHFTSPIRRYPDLLIHRLIKLYTAPRLNMKKVQTYRLDINTLGKHCTETEKNSMYAERASNKLALTLIARDHIGEVFEGRVTGVARYGLYIMLDNIFCEGLLHIKDMWDDYYYYEEEKLCLFGKRSKSVYRFGDKIHVKIIKASIDKREIDFELVK